MSKSSRSKQSKSKKTQQKSQPSAQRSTARQKVVHKERGTVLTILLVVMALHGMFAAYFYYVVRTQEAALSRPMVISLMVVHSLANIAAAAGIWYWKKWALYVYGASTVLALVVGLISVGIWSVFYMILPLVIVGWVLRTKWEYFT
jgi:hypothetical protein